MSQLNDSDIILFEYNFHYQNIRSKNTLDIAFGIDRNFLFGCGVAIASILLNNSEISCEFHVFTDYISDKDKLYFSDLAKQYNSRINIYVINCDKLKSLPSTKNWTYATYFRFIIADYFYNKHEKILYLDADIACKGSIKELLDYQFSTNEIAAVVAERDVEWWQNRASVLTTPQLASGYFNAGFLLINIDEWNLNNISSKAIEMLRDPDWVSKITHLDQDVLNVLLNGKVKFISGKYNTRYSINYELKDKVDNPVNDDTVFIHYVGPTKPWHEWADYPVSRSFLIAKAASPWCKEDLLKPVNSNQYRYCAKHKFKQKHYIEKCF